MEKGSTLFTFNCKGVTISSGGEVKGRHVYCVGGVTQRNPWALRGAGGGGVLSFEGLGGQ